MSNLRMPIDDIKDQIRFNCGRNWNNYSTTNCYAYALGLDIPEERIITKAYQPGTIGSTIYNIDLNNKSLEEKIYADLRALQITYSDCSQSEISCYDFDNDSIIVQWIIALFINRKDETDFHFMRKAWDNNWWHKRGYNLERPLNYDDMFKTIYNPEECELYDYKYIKCLKLNCKVK